MHRLAQAHQILCQCSAALILRCYVGVLKNSRDASGATSHKWSLDGKLAAFWACLPDVEEDLDDHRKAARTPSPGQLLVRVPVGMCLDASN